MSDLIELGIQLYTQGIHVLNELLYGLSYREVLYMLFCLVAVLILYLLSKFSRLIQLTLIFVSFVFSTIYIYWRTVYTLEFDTTADVITSILLLGAEYLGYFQQAIFYFLMHRGTNVKDTLILDVEYYPTVDVFVATYNEPVSVLKRTLTACTYLDYPADKVKVYVCDDGDRTEVEDLAKELGVFYIRRDSHEHAKAGNLNNAMKCTDGELILTLDADMVPKSYFLKNTVAYFQKRRAGFVQAPQLFFNSDPFQYNLSSSDQISNEQDFFMIEMQAAKSHYNAPMYVGSNCIFSRSALVKIGGFATGSITEDVATGMLLQAEGYRTYFVKDVLARGLSPESFSEMLHQRDRWCRGNLQAIRKWNPLKYPGLSFSQKLLYLSGAFYWYFGVQKFIYLVSPVLFLDFGIRTLNATFFSILLFWLPQFHSSMSTFRMIAKGRRTTFWSHIYETAMSPKLAVSAVTESLFIKRSGFRVTKKGIESRQIQIVWQSFVPLVALLIGYVYGFALQSYWVANGRSVPSFYWINDFWGLYNLVSIIMSIFVCIDRPRRRKSERFSIRVPIKLQTKYYTYTGITMDISENGARVQLSESVFGVTDKLNLSVEGIGGLIHAREVQALLSDRFEMRLVWDNLPLPQYKQLIKLMYDQHEDIMEQFRYSRGANILSSLLRSANFYLKRKDRHYKKKRIPFDQSNSTISS